MGLFKDSQFRYNETFLTEHLQRTRNIDALEITDFKMVYKPDSLIEGEMGLVID